MPCPPVPDFSTGCGLMETARAAVPAEIPESFYEKLKEEIVEELSVRNIQSISENRMKER